MKIIKSVKIMQQESLRNKKNGLTIGFVPTMGYFHEGHISLMQKCREENDIAIVSIFVNPVQFCAGDDFDKYPRDLERDARMVEKGKFDYLFFPSNREMYPDDYLTYIEVERLSNLLCGKIRKGHFKGVTTVVAKLINITMPDTVYFGQKDAQQAIIISKMLTDLNFNVKMKILPTMREKDGLAMSSRNVYLSPHQRKIAPVLYKSLMLAEKLIKKGEKRAVIIKKEMKKLLQSEKQIKIEYITICDNSNLIELKEIKKGETLIALAAHIGSTRLIDNIII